ncbi:MAG: septation protein IspZ [Brevundimonas sp.]|uniref:inner membrane-spanning protein YciB n=1 Tax=Brevundimonas sp. TaxID=1871086 RepID=UPI0027356B0A|nr:septation protein IspZ [Brevundimonas sp.]MDP3377498.1 septation protein IspZ [Brevundimonas sp.]
MSERPSPPTWVRQAVDFGALIAFAGAFLFYRLNGLAGDEALVQATWFLVAGAAVAVAVGLVVERRLALMPLIVGGFALVFGLLTVLTQDDLWVKLKVTILNLSLSILLLGGLKMGKQPLKALLGTVIPINDRAWKILTLRYGLFFAAVALVNEAVRSEALVGWATGLLGYEDIDPADVWVSFRGVLWIASSVFGLSNMPLIFRNLQSETGDEAVTPPPGPNAAP